MSKFNEVKNEALNLRSDARKALLIDLLRAEENHVANSMIPLEADHRAAMKKKKTTVCSVSPWLLPPLPR
ncbi:hypothetical protein [Allobaculum sp. Allo2]|uniref:hypothetical protein n=1 Tax=Allobaculum sp. Allo2 TaxID=2853432 RepID=UPI001F624545|nr:hypothetical protein [Allobaculum sp. Allo2]UNT92773.1 hypothetical protein KWG61_11810 [Allobaculum sp. Allo2]